ncbi:MAG: hypothetical protein ACK2UW_25315 [Anaerolineales bacterium]
MLRFVVSVFFVLHGLVHLLYLGQSRRLFELQSGMTWPDGSWAFSKLLGDETTRLLAGILLILAAVGFVAAGVGVFAGQGWWRPLAIGSAVLSAVLYLLFWNGRLQGLDNQGGIGLLIDLAVLVLLLVFNWPHFDF